MPRTLDFKISASCSHLFLVSDHHQCCLYCLWESHNMSRCSIRCSFPSCTQEGQELCLKMHLLQKTVRLQLDPDWGTFMYVGLTQQGVHLLPWSPAVEWGSLPPQIPWWDPVGTTRSVLINMRINPPSNPLSGSQIQVCLNQTGILAQPKTT